MEIVCPYCGETIAVFIDEGGRPMNRIFFFTTGSFRL